MSSRTRWIVALVLGLMASPAWAQTPLGTANLGAPVWEHPLPLMWGQRDEGFYFSAEAVAMRLNNALRGDQVIARRGMRDHAGDIHGSGLLVDIFDTANPPNYITTLFQDRGTPGQILGTGDVALTTGDAARDVFQPGGRVNIGYRFRNGMTVEMSYMGISRAKNTAYAGIIPPDQNAGNGTENAFLFGDYFNYSPYFAGPNRDVVSDVILIQVPAPGPPLGGQGNSAIQIAPVPQDWNFFGGWLVPAYGITNGAEFVSIYHIQSIDVYDLNLRVPVAQFEGTRTYWTGGFRYMSHLERFRMRWEDNGFDETPGDPFDGGIEGNVSRPEWALQYTVKQKNRFYGLQTGVGGEAYLFNGFAVSLDTKFGVFAQNSRTSTVLQRLDVERGIGIKHTNNQMNLAAMFQGGAYLWWYPVEGIQLRVGYEYMGILGAKRLVDPIDYDWGRLNPRAKNTFLSLDGIVAGVSFAF